MIDSNDMRSIIEHLRSELLPVGTILIYSSENVPAGFMPCDGRELSKSRYPELYALIGGTWGESSTSFYLPDLQGQFIRGWDKEGDEDPERMFGSFQDDAFQGHSHNVDSCSENGRHFHYVGYTKSVISEANTFFSNCEYKYICNYDYEYKTGNMNSDKDGNHKHEITIGLPIDSTFQKVRMSTETRPKNIALMFCIKVK